MLIFVWLQLTTKEEWITVLYGCIDSTAVDMYPIRDNNPVVAVLFLVFMLFGYDVCPLTVFAHHAFVQQRVAYTSWRVRGVALTM